MNLINLKNISHPTLLSNSLLRLVFALALFFTVHLYSFAASIIIDSEVDNGIRKLITPIVKASGMDPKELKLYIIADPTVNAFVRDGESIFIYTGLITLFNDPDVLKGVVAHELGHMRGGHIFRSVEKGQEILSQTTLMSLFGIAAGILAGSPELAAGSVAGSMHTANRQMMRHSRIHESSADQAAIEFLHETKNTVNGLVKLQEYFAGQQRYFDRANQYAITHPLSTERAEVVKLALQDEKGQNYSSTKEEKEIYSRIVAKLSGFLDPIAPDKKYEYDFDLFTQSYQDALFAYRKNDFKLAISILDSLITQEPNNPYLYQVKGEFLGSRDQLEESVKNYKIATDLDSQDIILKAEYALALVNTIDSHMNDRKRTEVLNETITLLRAVNSSRFKNPYIYRNLAIAYGKLGDLANSNLMLAEEALMYSKKDDAQLFIEKAKKYVKNDAKLKLRIDDFIKTLPNVK